MRITRPSSITRRIALATSVAALAMATGCIHVSQRALDNGRAMQSSWQYREVMRGNVNRQTLQGMYWQSNALSASHRTARYRALTHW